MAKRKTTGTGGDRLKINESGEAETALFGRAGASTKNVICSASDLGNEATVEQFFVLPLLRTLGYKDSHVKLKESIDRIAVSQGRKRVPYRPDFVLMHRRRPRVVVDAKATDEQLEEWVGQCGSYCHELNKKFDGENPVTHFVLTNGRRTLVYRWDAERAVAEVALEDLGSKRTPAYSRLNGLIGRKAIVDRAAGSSPRKTEDDGLHMFAKKGREEVNDVFLSCDDAIHKQEDSQQSWTFTEFVKLVFLKLHSDKEVHRKHPGEALKDSFRVPAEDVLFSTRTLDIRGAGAMALAFDELRDGLEKQIGLNRRKRMFDVGERLRLKAETVRTVVSKLEHLDLRSIDADLNGRLFESFLNATMRGKNLGQYFTPRSVVKLAVGLAGLTAGPTAEKTPLVVDPCCGSGGFLIEALAQMWAKIDANNSLSDQDKDRLKDVVAQEKLVGIDKSNDPPLVRLARINMFLHGDGGTRIFTADGLDSDIQIPEKADAERTRELEELRGLGDGYADVVLANPPFSRVYKGSEAADTRVLAQYPTYDGLIKTKGTVKTNRLFIERYATLLGEGGRAVAVVDDGILGGKNAKVVRDDIRRLFIIEAVISLPGDAFQRSQARVKTSILVLRKRRQNEEQPSCFMDFCTAVGVDDPSRSRSLPSDRHLRDAADLEVKRVIRAFEAFRRGGSKANSVSSKVVKTGRIDVKSCLPKRNRLAKAWGDAGRTVVTFGDLVHVYDADNLPDEDVILRDSAPEDAEVTFIRVRYDGVAEDGEVRRVREQEYPILCRVRSGDVVVSNINAVNGSVAVVPEWLTGRAVSNEYTILRPKEGVDAHLVWMLMRTPEARADLLIAATGYGRTRVTWGAIRDTKVALPSDDAAEVAEKARAWERAVQDAAAVRSSAESLLNDDLGTDNDVAARYLTAFKPPR